LKGVFTQTNIIDKKYPKEFKAWICNASNHDLKLGEKINNIGIYFDNISFTKTGLPLQNKLKKTGAIPVFGGKNIGRYYIKDIKGYVSKKFLNENNIKFKTLLQPKIISQDIIAHIQNPKPHIKLTATIDLVGDIITLNTIQNTFITDPNFDLIFIATLFNSKLINWYTHKFIFCDAVRTMHFTHTYIKKIPIPLITLEQQKSIIEQADKIITIKKNNFKENIFEYEKKIDELVYKLYNLTKAEIKLIENSL
jgi:hypothetical protein